MSEDFNNRERKYRNGYLKGFEYALILVRRGDTLEEIENFMKTDLKSWYEAGSGKGVTLELPPAYRK
jgi:hypothetical protein